MGRTTIPWTQRSWNPVRGTKGRHICLRISPGCKRCYAAAMNRRFSGLDYVAGADEPRLDAAALLEPFTWRDASQCFVCSMTDLFWERIPDAFIDRVFAVMALRRDVTFQVLTKRAERLHAYMAAPDRKRTIAATVMELSNLLACQAGSAAARIKLDDFSASFTGAGPFPNIWLGVSVETQEYADARIPWLLQTPAAVRWVSYEPALGPVDFERRDGNGSVDYLTGTARPNAPLHADPPYQAYGRGLDWIVVGGESGAGAEAFDLRWARLVRDQCRAAGVPFFFKQAGSHAFDSDRAPGGWCAETRVTGAGGKGEDLAGIPEDLHVREWPTP